jgi:hypothetical protein
MDGVYLGSEKITGHISRGQVPKDNSVLTFLI